MKHWYIISCRSMTEKKVVAEQVKMGAEEAFFPKRWKDSRQRRRGNGPSIRRVAAPWITGYVWALWEGQPPCHLIREHERLYMRVLAPGGVPYKLTDEDMARMRDVPKRLAEAIEAANRAEREAREAVQRPGAKVTICQGVLEGMEGTVEGPHKDGVSVDAGLGGRIVVPVDFLRIAA